MHSTKENLQILFEDNHIIIVNKRAGDITQGDKTGDKPLSEVVKEYIKDKYNKPGNVYLGVVHRLDRPTSGIIIFAKTSNIVFFLNFISNHTSLRRLLPLCCSWGFISYIKKYIPYFFCSLNFFNNLL